jgi:hypothetical protein
MTDLGRSMLVLGVAFVFFPASSIAAPVPERGRTIKDLSDAIPVRVLQRSISPKFYQSLLISPLDGWIVVRARVSQTHLSGARVIRSSLNGAYDSLALTWANEVRLAGNYSTGQIGPTDSVLMHLLIYHIADGTMALAFPSLDGPGGSQMKYFGSARLAVLKSDGQWTEIKGPPGLQGKGWAVRESGVRNNLKLDRIPQHFQSGSVR